MTIKDNTDWQNSRPKDFVATAIPDDLPDTITGSGNPYILLRERTIYHLQWMSDAMKHEHDDDGLQVGHYSPELTVAIKFLNELKGQ